MYIEGYTILTHSLISSTFKYISLHNFYIQYEDRL